jgi:hypothetical protein
MKLAIHSVARLQSEGELQPGLNSCRIHATLDVQR